MGYHSKKMAENVALLGWGRGRRLLDLSAKSLSSSLRRCPFLAVSPQPSSEPIHRGKVLVAGGAVATSLVTAFRRIRYSTPVPRNGCRHLTTSNWQDESRGQRNTVVLVCRTRESWMAVRVNLQTPLSVQGLISGPRRRLGRKQFWLLLAGHSDRFSIHIPSASAGHSRETQGRRRSTARDKWVKTREK